MCVKSHSESGQPCGFEPCAEYKHLDDVYRRVMSNNTTLQDERDELYLTGKDLNEKVFQLEDENAALRQEKDALNNAVMKLEGECVTLIRQTQKIDRLRQDRDRLAGIVEKADELADSLVSGCECCGNPCIDYTLARLYQEARHAG